MTRRRQPLSRYGIRQSQIRSKGAVFLQYETHERIGGLDGYPDGTFFAVIEQEVPFSTEIALLAAEAGVDLDLQPNARVLRHAIVEAMVALAKIEAPEYLDELGLFVAWRDRDLRELESAYNRRVVIVDGFTSVLERQLRAVPRANTTLRMVAPFETSAALTPTAGLIDGWVPRLAVPPPAPLPSPLEPESESEPPAASSAPASSTLKTVETAVVVARESELPQRLPQGARRQLQRLPPGIYVVIGDTLEPRDTLAAGIVDAQSAARHDRETTVISWDGEWPVVVRRYGDRGRTIYRVEEALRRSGLEERVES